MIFLSRAAIPTAKSSASAATATAAETAGETEQQRPVPLGGGPAAPVAGLRHHDHRGVHDDEAADQEASQVAAGLCARDQPGPSLPAAPPPPAAAATPAALFKADVELRGAGGVQGVAGRLQKGTYDKC